MILGHPVQGTRDSKSGQHSSGLQRFALLEEPMASDLQFYKLENRDDRDGYYY